MVCRVGVVKGEQLLRYSFPPPHPFNSERVARFWGVLEDTGTGIRPIEPEKASEGLIELFHVKEHVEFVRKASMFGYGYLDGGDTPAFPGVFEAAQFAVGSTVSCVEKVISGELDHAFNPVGGLHHARRNTSAGFCVFNDIGVSIEVLRRRGVRRVLYVDIDVHHGDGVFYAYEEDPGIFVFDIHEDGRFLYPGSGASDERGKGPAAGTKVNLPLNPGSGDAEVAAALPDLERFAIESRPEFVIFQCGADGMSGDPLGGLRYTTKTHARVAKALHRVAHQTCDGRMVALGGGGYDPDNCAMAWNTVVVELVSG